MAVGAGALHHVGRSDGTVAATTLEHLDFSFSAEFLPTVSLES
jgi:hypothetical protein